MTNVPLEVLFSIVFESRLYLKLTTPFSCEIYKDSPLTKMNVLNRLTKKFPIYYPFTSLNSISLKKERKKKNIQPTCSTLANTLSKLRPANFLISSSVHVGSSSSVANNWGYLETSSNPVGVLEKRASIIHQFQSTFDFQRFSCRSENRKRERVSTTIKLNSSLGINGSNIIILYKCRHCTPCVPERGTRHPLDCNCFVEVSSIDNDYSLNSALRYSKR